MKFEQALDLLKQDKYVTRAAWEETTGEYIVLLPGMTYIWKVLFAPNPSCGNWLPMIQDIDADDWKLVEVKK